MRVDTRRKKVALAKEGNRFLQSTFESKKGERIAWLKSADAGSCSFCQPEGTPIGVAPLSDRGV